MDKPLTRLYPIDIERLTWVRPPDSPDGVMQKVLARDPTSGSATRLLKVEPRADTGVFVHEHWEEVYLLEGSYKMGEEFHPAGTYTCKGPGVHHGPFLTNDGYLCLEFRDFHGPSMDKPNVRLYPVDIERLAWKRPEGSPEGIVEKVLTAGPSGSTTRLIKVDPGIDMGVVVHDFWEEVYILEGSYKTGTEFHPAGTYVCRPPGVELGPTITEEGYLCLDLRNHV